MNLQYSMPPQITGSAAEDTAALSTWCGGLLSRLKKAIMSIEDGNILSVSADKLTDGNIGLSGTVIASETLAIDSDSITFTITDESGTKTMIRAAVTADSTEFTVTSKSGTRYIRLSGGKLEIAADTISAQSIEADEISAESLSISGSITAGTIHCDVLDAGTIIGQ